MIALRGVSKTYVHEIAVLSQVHLTVERGGFLYVVGGTGAGKTTLLRMLATEEAPTQGTVTLFGYDLSRVSPGTLRAIRRSIGYVPQSVQLIPDLTVLENIALSLKLAGHAYLGAEGRAKIGHILEKMELGSKREEIAGRLSGGEAQRIAIARALVRSPELLIADEPTGAQDRQHTWSLMDSFVRSGRDGMTVVLATHDPEIVRRVRKRCALIKAGKVFMEESLCTY